MEDKRKTIFRIMVLLVIGGGVEAAVHNIPIAPLIKLMPMIPVPLLEILVFVLCMFITALSIYVILE